jgi:flagellar biosynthesis protein FlhG
MAMNQAHSSGGFRRTKTLSITSGKGGVGKTTLVVNSALHLSQLGHKVLILDGDMGMGNVDIMFGVRSRGTLDDVLKGRCALQDILIQPHPGITLIPSGSGILGLQNLDDSKKKQLLEHINTLPMNYDYLLVDTAPGIDNNVLYLNTAVSEICIVLSPDPSSLADSYALIKVLHKYYRENRFSIICNQVAGESEGLLLFNRLSDVASRFLVVGLDYFGSIPQDPNLSRATRSQQLIMKSNPKSESAQAIRTMTRKFSVYKEMESFRGGMQFFFEQLFQVA